MGKGERERALTEEGKGKRNRTLGKGKEEGKKRSRGGGKRNNILLISESDLFLLAPPIHLAASDHLGSLTDSKHRP